MVGRSAPALAHFLIFWKAEIWVWWPEGTYDQVSICSEPCFSKSHWVGFPLLLRCPFTAGRRLSAGTQGTLGDYSGTYSGTLPKGGREAGFPLQVLSPFPWREGGGGTFERGMQRYPDSRGYQSLHTCRFGSWWQISVVAVRIGRPNLVPVIWLFE